MYVAGALVEVYVAAQHRTGQELPADGSFELFALSAEAPYVLVPDYFLPATSSNAMTKIRVGYMDDLTRQLPEDFKGPFTVGVRWDEPGYGATYSDESDDS